MNKKTIRLIGFRLGTFGYSSLSEYYTTDKWELVKKRLKKARVRYCCEVCKSQKRLQIHHKSYKTLCKENLNHLCILCFDCHKQCHALAERKKWTLWYATKKFRRLKRFTISQRMRREDRDAADKKYIEGVSSKAQYKRTINLNESNCNPVKSYFLP